MRSLKLRAVIVLSVLMSVCSLAFAGQTTNMTLNQKTTMSLSVIGSDGKAVPASAYTVAATVADPTCVSYNVDAFGEMIIQALKTPCSTTINYSITPNPGSGYIGAPLTLGPDTFNVISTLSLASATNSYSTPQ